MSERNLKDFATKESPLRASSIHNLLLCEWRYVLQFGHVIFDESKEAADTGSLVHHGVAHWHNNKRRDINAAMEAMREALAKFPEGDFDDACANFVKYSEDPRNNIELVLCERQLNFEIPSHPSDPTGQAIHIQGTLDQVRRNEKTRRLQVWDIKTSKLPGMQLLLSHMLQVTTYAYGASILLGEPVEPGGLICTRKYFAKTVGMDEPSPLGVFFHAAWTTDFFDDLMDKVKWTVARIRSGQPTMSPGYYCAWCPAQSPENCRPMLQQFKRHELKLVEKSVILSNQSERIENVVTIDNQGS